MTRWNIANIITGFRILGAVLLLFFPLFSLGFYVTYLLCGVSDMTDGVVARKTNSTSSFGAKFDTVADLVFMTVVCCKLLPSIQIPQWLWVWIITIAVFKVSNLVLGALRRKTLVSVHSVLNKATGLMLFHLPLTMQFVAPKYSLTAVCLIATFAAIQEGHYIRTGRGKV